MQGLYVIIVLRIIQGIACASFRPVIYGMLDSKVNSHSLDKGRSFGIFDISFYAALAVGPCLGGLIKDILGFRWLFIALCILCAIAIAINKYFIINDKYNFVNENPVYSDESISKAEYSLYFFIMGKSVMLACMTIFFPIFLVNETHLSSLKVGIILAIPATMMSIFLKPMGDLADKETNGLFVFIGGIMTSTAYLLFPLIDSFNDAIIFTAFCGFFSAMSQPSSVTLLLNNVSPNTSVEAVGRLNSVMGIGYAVGAFFCSILTKYVPIKDIFVNSGIIGLVSMCSFILFLNTKTFFFVTKWFVSKE
ncbi:MFS transporter [Seleniivibrio sp.]|uniref:MFS transporter n=1 Tax=Seleniivibrio sp. TaxID=2898801 RepID=UPI0025E195C3|nr:MFS transporter [Seleniivibrio sp.]MCD8554825.1 MFS transporter [Seleniivibrio sp.]